MENMTIETAAATLWLVTRRELREREDHHRGYLEGMRAAYLMMEYPMMEYPDHAERIRNDLERHRNQLARAGKLDWEERELAVAVFIDEPSALAWIGSHPVGERELLVVRRVLLDPPAPRVTAP